MAASEGDSDMIHKVVAEEQISPSHEFQHGVTALHEACEGGHVEAAQCLIDLGADVNKQVHNYDIVSLPIPISMLLPKIRSHLQLRGPAYQFCMRYMYVYNYIARDTIVIFRFFLETQMPASANLISKCIYTVLQLNRSLLATDPFISVVTITHCQSK